MTTDRIRLFIGSSANGEDAEADMVAEYAVRRNTSVPVDITWMRVNRDPDSAWGCWDTTRWATPFSGLRWAIPEFCGGEGRAIYADHDVVFLHDLERLWSLEMNGRPCLARSPGRYCVTLFDCERAGRLLPPIEEMRQRADSHARCTYVMDGHTGTFDDTWNVFDGQDLAIEQIAGLHYTDMSSNPAFEMSRRRLKAEGRKHWYDGPIRKHRRTDCVKLFEILYEESLTNGNRCLEDYVPLTPYGEYDKLSQSGYRANNGWD